VSRDPPSERGIVDFEKEEKQRQAKRPSSWTPRTEWAGRQGKKWPFQADFLLQFHPAQLLK